MDSQTMMNLVAGSALTVLWWFARQLWSAIQNMQKNIKDIEVAMPTHYIRRSEVDNRFDRVETMLDKIFDRLDTKANK
jgi:hypothetical protein